MGAPPAARRRAHESPRTPGDLGIDASLPPAQVPRGRARSPGSEGAVVVGVERGGRGRGTVGLGLRFLSLLPSARFV
ncbi:hypothetical protein E2562_015668 [Oryza meyeriana var. granulata]|uniref:Uncharacterized protein n=1 Tax=Oryza meyeriana var. granulata TaxID=110450 RepID=A0A6G1D4T9_9ORYZ|nr:hypothetical protein E2562_015668 [Oryza meyeriana var. granulata]